MRLILASQSPRRKELMALLRIPFEIRVADIDEIMDTQKLACDEVARVSRAKAEAVKRDADEVVVAADTIVVCDGQILGKPADEADAERMLTMLSGRSHQVMTGLTVLYAGECRSCTEITDITFAKLTPEQIRAYVATKEPMDKAGAYGIQGGAALFAEKITGDFYNVVGLPMCRLSRILREIAPELMEETQ